MRRLGLGLALLVSLVGCSKQVQVEKPRTQLITPNSRLIYHGGISLWTFCDRGNRVYVNETGHFQTIAGGCPDGSP